MTVLLCRCSFQKQLLRMRPFQLDYPYPLHTYASSSNTALYALFLLKNMKRQHFIQVHAYPLASLSVKHIHQILNNCMFNKIIFEFIFPPWAEKFCIWNGLCICCQSDH